MTKHDTNKTRLFEGLPVVDADDDVALVITPGDVKTSKKKNPGECAVAVAGRREFKTEVRVFLSRTYIKDPKAKRWIRFNTPERITKEIISFDRGSEFTPGEYTLKAIAESQRRGYKPTGPKTAAGVPQTRAHVTANVRTSARDY